MKAKYIIVAISLLIFGGLLTWYISTKDEGVKKETEVFKEVMKKKVEEKVDLEEVKAIIERKVDKPMGVLDEVKMKIETGNPYRQQEAIDVLVGIGDAAAVAQIEALAKDDTPSVVNRSLQALGELKSEASIPLINEVFAENEIRQDGHGESIRINAVMALGEIGSEESVPLLGEELEKRNVSFGSHVVEAMIRIGSEKSLPYLKEYETFLDEQLANMPGADVIGEYRFVWEQAAKQTKEAIEKIKEGL